MSLAEAEARIAGLFASAGASPANAASVAWVLVMAEADGLKGHGLSRVPTYLAMLKAGKIDGGAVPIARQPKPGVLAIDAAHGFAYPAIDLAVIELPEIARAQGVVAAPIRRSNHCGAAGLHVERLAEQGLVALLFANTPAASRWSSTWRCRRSHAGRSSRRNRRARPSPKAGRWTLRAGRPRMRLRRSPAPWFR
jgi:(2R)-3-sulfolactate dehydrogenase (NADP+)